jgi:hypothetical protein
MATVMCLAVSVRRDCTLTPDGHHVCKLHDGHGHSGQPHTCECWFEWHDARKEKLDGIAAKAIQTTDRRPDRHPAGA